MKTSSASITARVTLGAVLLLSGIALLCVAPLSGSYAANAKRDARTSLRPKPAVIGPALPNTGPTPATGTVNASGSQTANWDGTTISPGGNANTESTCMDNSSVFGCETFTLTVNGTQSDWAGKKVQVLLTWTSVTNEYDLYIHKGSNAGPLITSAVQGPALVNQVAYIDASNLTTDALHPTTVFTIHVVYDTTPDSATDEYHGSATPVPLTATSIAAAPQDTGPKVGFENFEPPGVLVPGSALSSGGVTVEYLGRGAGEPSLGANWVTGVVNFQSDLQTEFVTFNDSCNLSNPKASWVNRRAPTSNFIDSDPIGFTDHTSSTANRVFAAELTLLSPDTVKISHSDDDGVTWVPDQSGGLASAVDHETIGGGPYHSPLPTPVPSPTALPSPGVVYPHAIYYASQDIAFASCSRSDDGGSTYGPSVQMYVVTTCSGLHGHIKVAPDGTVYVPNRACGNAPLLNGGNTAVVVSTDNGITWTVKPVMNGSVPSTPATDDPAVAVDASGKVYCLFALGGTNAAVGTSTDQGTTWKNIFDVGAGLGLTNVAFPAAIGGDAGRAAVAFYASKAGSGDSSADIYTGVWHLYVAETFDGGDHWTTTDVTPTLPMQRMGLLRGGGGPMDRNLLDFFDITIDKDGRVLVGYVNGCSGGDCSQAPVNPDGSTTVTGNTYSATATIARQSSGRRLSGTNPVTPATSVPGMPFITERRVGPVVHLAWNEADPGNNGPNQTITNFQILRGTTSGGENPTPIATVAGNVNKLDDTTAFDPTVTYYYKVIATNSIGSSCANNEIAAPYVGDTCSGMIIHRNLPSHPEAVGGSETGVPVGPTPTPTATPTATPPIPTQYLIDYIAVAEPPSKPGKFLFQMKVGNLSTVPANSRWRMVWNSVSTPNEQYYVGMTTDASSVVTFEYGTVLTQSVPPVVGVIGLPTEEPVGTPDAASNFNADGTISIYVDKSLVGNPQPGDILGAVNGRTFNTGDTPPNTFQRSSLLIDHTFIKGNTDTSFPPATYTVVGNTSCPAGGIVPVSAVSRKTHGSAGTFDVDLPLIGTPGIECRTGGTNGNHTVVITFAVPVTVSSASATPGAGGSGSANSFSVNNTEVTVNLTGVSNAQTLTINLTGVTGGSNSGNVSIPMSVLAGDTTANGAVNSSDIAQTQSQSGQSVGLSNFREDVTVNGAINSSDIAFVQSRSGTALP
jgi:hypothetical protein